MLMTVQSAVAALREMFPHEEKAEGGGMRMAANQGGGVRRRQAPPAPHRARPAPQDQAVYPFFSDATYTTTVTRVSKGFGGAEIVEGGVPGTGLISLSIYTPEGERHEVHFTGNGRVYLAVARPDGTMEMQEHDPSLEPSWDEHAVAEGGEEGETEAEPPAIAMVSSSVEIDVMMVFDTTAAAWAQGNGGITNFANSAVSRMSTALANSGIGCTMRLAGIYCPPYTYGGEGLSTALTALRNGTGSLSGVATQRNACGADVVSMMVDTGSAYGTTGIGYMNGTPAKHVGASYAFSVCSVQSVNSSHTMSHEIGHNIGCDHSKYQQSSPAPSGTYAAGWYFTGSNGTHYHTIMAYNSDGVNNWTYQPCGLYSSPLVTYQGTAAGHAADGDNARCITENMAAVAAYRTSSALLSPPSTVTASTGTYTDKIRVAWSSVSGATSYKVFRNTSNSSSGAGQIATTSALLHDDTTATPGTLYFYWVKAANSTGDSAFSASAQGMRASTVPHDLRFYKPSAWPDAFFLGTSASSKTPETTFGQGLPIHLTYACDDAYNNTVTETFANRLSLTGPGVSRTYDFLTYGLSSGYYSGVEGALIEILQGLAPGTYTLTLTLNHNYVVTETDYSNNTRAIVFAVTGLAISLGEAVNAPSLIWQTGGGAAWFPEAYTTHDGLHAAQSGAITNNQSTWIETDVTGPGTLTFWWRVSSENNYDWLTCTTNGTRFTRISGTNALSWEQQQISLPPGQTTLRWTYSKDVSVAHGSDCGWLDDVTWTPLLVTQTTPRPVPFAWLDEMYPGNNGDYEALAFLPGANGLFTWESYVAGLVPTNASSRFQITNLVLNATGITALDWTPHRPDRTYKVWGMTNLTDGTWLYPTNSGVKFFKVSVDL